MRSARVGLSAMLAVAVTISLQPAQAVAAPVRTPPSPATPRQHPGTAAGKPHQVTAKATAPKKGAKPAPATKAKRPKNAVAEFKLHRPVRQEKLAKSAVHTKPVEKAAPAPKAPGLAKRTRARRGDLSSATTTVFQNSDGTFTAEVHRTPVNRKAADGTWVADPAAPVATVATPAAKPPAATTPAAKALAAAANPAGQRTTSGSTYVKSGVTQNFSGDNALYVGSQTGAKYNSFIKFDGFASTFPNAYVVSAKLFLDTEFSGTSGGSCASTATSVAPITASWNPATLNTFPGPAVGKSIGTASWAGGVNCSQGRVWGAVPLNPRTFTNWAHGWAANYGLAVTAPYTDASWKEFNPDDPYLSIEYAADGAGASYAETQYLSPWNNKTGWAKVTVQNEGSATWTPTNGYKLGYQIYTVAGGVRTLFSTSNYLTTMPGTVAPKKSATVTATLPALTPGKTYQVCWDMVHNTQYFSGLGIPQTCYALDVVNNAPVMDSLFPYNNSTQYTQTPTLYMTAHDVDAYPGTALTYNYKLYELGSTTVLATSGSTTSARWTVPADKLAWGGTYYWQAQVSDNTTASAWSQPAYFSVPSPDQPLITSHLGAAPADATVNGVNPSAGNYSTQVVDAAAPPGMRGPAFEIRRTYNSLDPRLTNAFGAGWSSLLDTHIETGFGTDNPGDPLVVLPNGREERFGTGKRINPSQGEDSDVELAPPAGSRDHLYIRGLENFELLDASGTRYIFNVYSGDLQYVVTRHADYYLEIIHSSFDLVDAGGQTHSFDLPSSVRTYDGVLYGEQDGHAGPSLDLTWGLGQVTTASGSITYLPHVTKVTQTQTDSLRPRVWNYGYDTANNLASVCPPASATACATYAYTTGTASGSHFATTVLDTAPKAYWRLNDAAGSAKATDQVAVNVGTYDAALTAVTLGQPGALPGTPATSASFNGTSSKMVLPDHLLDGSTMAIGMWFKTTQAGGTLLSYQGTPAGTSTTTNYTPAIYVGSDGKLRGQFYGGKCCVPMTSAAAVNNGKWHHVVLSGAATNQTLFLDGAQIGTLAGGTIAPTPAGLPYVTVGAGQLAGSWPAAPAGNPLGWFAGQIQEVSFGARPLSLAAVQQEYAAGTTAARELVSSKLPSGKTAATLTYDAVTDRATSVTTGDGGTFQFGGRSTTGSTEYYRGAVVSTRPSVGYPMDEDSGTVAVNDLGLQAYYFDHRDGVYNNVVLGAPGIFGDGGDTAASFDGTSSYMSLPDGSVNEWTGKASIGMWFKTKTAKGVLFSYQDSPVESTPTKYTPALYVGTDGKLRGQFWDGNVSPMASLAPVTDGNWHMVLLTANGTGQTLWLDGVKQGSRTGATIAGQVDANDQFTDTVGTGYLGGLWPARPATAEASYFTGQIAEVTFHSLDIDQLTPGAAAYLYQAAGSSMTPSPTTKVTVTEPGGSVSTVTMDPGNGMRTTGITNSLGQSTTYTYDTLGNRVAVTDPNGHVQSSVYDTHGNAVQQTSCQTEEQCQTSSYAYYWNAADPTDPRNGKVLYSADARAGSTGTANTAYRMAYTYTTDGYISTVTTPPTAEAPQGRTTTYTYGETESVTQPGGQKTAYRRNPWGQITSVVEPSGLTTTYTYDTQRLLPTSSTTVSDAYPQGLTSQYTYDDRDRVVTAQAPATTDVITGRVHTPYTTVEFDADGNVTKQAVADRTGLDATRTSSYTYTAGDRLESLTDPLGNKTSYAYNGFGWNTGSTAPDGLNYRYDYSSAGDLLTTTLQGWTGDPAAPSAPADLVLESRAYDPAGQLASVTDVMGRTTAYGYWDDGLLSWTSDATGTADEVTTGDYFYDAAGYVSDECQNAAVGENCALYIEYFVDAAGRITKTNSSSDDTERTVEQKYDVSDNVVSQTLSDDDGHSRTVSYGYDAVGRPTSRTVPNGPDRLTSTTTFDQRGLPVTQTDPRGNMPGAVAADYTSIFRYDEGGRQVAVSTPSVQTENVGGTAVKAVATTSVGYNTFGEPVEQRSPTGRVQTSTFDADGQTASTAWPAYTPPGAGAPITPTVRYAYDKLGQLLTQTDPLGNDTTFAYDQLGNQTSQTAPDGHTTRASYDAAGEQLSTTDATGARSEATYDALGQMATSTELVRGTAPAAYTTLYRYDASGEPTTVTDPLGHTTTQVHDGFGQLLSETDAVGDTTAYEYDVTGQLTKATAPDDTATVTAYDDAGRLVTATEQDKTGNALRTTAFGYDPVGNRISSTDPLHKTVTASYDALNRTVAQTQPGSTGQSITTSFGYNADNQATRYTGPNGNATTYTYNALGLPESTVVPPVSGQTAAADRTTWLAYDAGGRLTSTTRPGNVTITGTYDKVGRLLSQAGAGAEAATANRSYDYDADGRVVSATAANSTEKYTYDDRGLLLTSNMPGWNTAFGYDAAGRITAQTDPSGVTGFGYDNADRQTSQNDPLTGSAVTVGYNKLDQPTDVTYGNGGATRSYGYDALHQLTSDVLKNPAGGVQASVAYAYDDGGHLTSKTTSGVAGAGSNTYAYDDAGRLASWTAGAVTTPYSYDPEGNRTRAGPTTFTYNARSQLTAATSGSDTTSYRYTARGTTSAIVAGGTTTAIASDAYDEQITNGSSSYVYDAFGRMTGLTTPGGSRSFTYGDQSNNVASDGTQTFGYTAGGAALSTATGGTGSFLNVDRHGDVTGTFTATGSSLTSSTSYDPYGKVLATGGAAADLGYQGGWTDPTTSFVNAAARWYNPGTGTFTSADTQQNAPTPAVNANPYAYGNDDPLGNSDPTGHDACTLQLTTEALLKALKTKADAMADKFKKAKEKAAAEKAKREQDARDAERERERVHRNQGGGGGGGGGGGNGGSGNAGSGSGSTGGASGGSTGTGYQNRSSRDDAYDNARSGSSYDGGSGSSGSSSGGTFSGSKRSGTKKTHWYNNSYVQLAGLVVATGILTTTVAPIFVLAASSSTTCTPGNAPAKPKTATPSRSAGPGKATGPAGNAGQVSGDVPDPATAPADAPIEDIVTNAPQDLPNPDDCFQGAYKRTDGTRTAAIWQCGGGGDGGGEAIGFVDPLLLEANQRIGRSAPNRHLYKVATEMTTPGGQVYYGFNGHPNENLTDLVEEYKAASGNKRHLKCAEMHCISQAVADGVPFTGSTMRSITIGNAFWKEHGTPIAPCENHCAPFLPWYNITASPSSKPDDW